MNKQELIEILSSEGDISKASAERAFNAMIDAVEAGLKSGDKIVISGFGHFETGQRAAREGRNPQTGETIQIKASTVVKFKPAKKLKEAVNQ
ncbi:MAG: HU family DNA-binding protein [Gammaproteobacteria bacterium]|nr:HU family DNA-binding protein [Gammaproteobacteria bacterium]MCH9744425.1 HU family DNA-binding protein [Gammaproteobacteria bacterium]